MSIPSRVADRYWIYAYRLVGEYPNHTINGGKWLLFFHISEIDEKWEIIKKLTEDGLLGRKSKVSTALPSSNAEDVDTHVICIFTYNSEDLKDVMRIREALKSAGFDYKIPYKCDSSTRYGIYTIKGHSKISKYYV